MTDKDLRAKINALLEKYECEYSELLTEPLGISARAEWFSEWGPSGYGPMTFQIWAFQDGRVEFQGTHGKSEYIGNDPKVYVLMRHKLSEAKNGVAITHAGKAALAQIENLIK